MQKFSFLNILIVLNTLSFTLTPFSEALNITPSSNASQQSNVKQNVWTRVKAKFDREKFLKDCNDEHNTTYSNNMPNLLNDTCWNALYTLKDLYKRNNDKENYTFAYQSMAKLLLTYNIFPHDCDTEEKQKLFLGQLITKIGQGITPPLARNKYGKIKRWFHVYEGMLFLKYADMSALEDRRERHITNAFHEFSEAINLKTTKTTYLLAAETILDYGHTPQNMTRPEAEQLAYEYIQFALTKEQKSKKTSHNNNPIELTTVEKHAQPTYINELNKPNAQNIAPTTPNNFIVENDTLEDYNLNNLHIPHRLNDDNLPLRNKPINLLGGLQEIYNINGRTVRRQNVLGNNMRCFFNAIGLNVNGQIAQLAFFGNDPIVRYMIANEIVSAATDHHQISDQIKQAIDYNLYADQRAELDRLEIERNNLLIAQNTNPDFQHPENLPLQYQNIRERGEEILEQLRRRSFTFNAYNTFINHYIGNGEMMATLRDVEQNGNANYTSIDAIAYLEKIGIKIFTLNQDGALELIHTYIPQDVTEVAYLYHEGIHFQALVPVEENEPEDINDIYVETNNSSKTVFPSSEELKKMYSDVQTNICKSVYDTDTVRKILYAKTHLNIKNTEIGSLINLDARRISEILAAHNIHKHCQFSDAIKEKMLQAYLEFYDDLKNKKIFIKDFSSAFLNQLKKEEENIKLKNENIINFFTPMSQQKIESYNKKKAIDVLKLYLDRNGFIAISQKTKLNFITILSILSQKLNPKEYRNPVNLEIKKKNLSEDEKKKIITDTFNALKIKNEGKDPTITDVARALEEHKISRKICERILKAEKLVLERVRSQHLSMEIVEKIRNDFEQFKLNSGQIEKTYQLLAKKYNVTFEQVKEIATNKTYQSDKKKQTQANYDRVIKTFHELKTKLPGNEMIEDPVGCIMRSGKVSLSKDTIRNYLKKAGLYQPGREYNVATVNITATPKTKSNILIKRKRNNELEDDDKQLAKKKRKGA